MIFDEITKDKRRPELYFKSDLSISISKRLKLPLVTITSSSSVTRTVRVGLLGYWVVIFFPSKLQVQYINLIHIISQFQSCDAGWNNGNVLQNIQYSGTSTSSLRRSLLSATVASKTRFTNSQIKIKTEKPRKMEIKSLLNEKHNIVPWVNYEW